MTYFMKVANLDELLSQIDSALNAPQEYDILPCQHTISELEQMISDHEGVEQFASDHERYQSFFSREVATSSTQSNLFREHLLHHCEDLEDAATLIWRMTASLRSPAWIAYAMRFESKHKLHVEYVRPIYDLLAEMPIDNTATFGLIPLDR